MRPLLVILGPTASGKSAVALEAARLAGADLLSVDSMQVYRGMDVGTAKPTAAERAGVPHHLLDVADPNEAFSVARFVELADQTIAGAASRGVPLIATGGTPLYYKALFEGLFEGPAADAELRRRLGQLSNEQLHQRLSAVDPQAVTRIHRNDTRRLIRALEVFELTGTPISAFQTEWAAAEPRYPAVWVGLHWERDALNRRINARARAMLAGGWLEETRQLLEQYGSFSPTAGGAVGYHELSEHLAGRLSWDEAAERIKINTRQLARRQVKWFRRWGQVRWLAGEASATENAAEAVRMWRCATP